jgi:hypothetical protein
MLPLSLSTPRVKTATTLLSALAASAAFIAAAPHAHASACSPQAYVPSVSGGYGYAQGYLPCGGSFTIRLANNAGSSLGETSNSCSSACGLSYGPVRCAGAIVHTFIYVNVNGVGMSDTSGTIQC